MTLKEIQNDSLKYDILIAGSDQYGIQILQRDLNQPIS